MEIKLFDKTINLLSNALDTRAFRNSLISSNIANQDTPGYEGKDVDFKAVFKGAKEELKQGGATYNHAGILMTTDVKHISNNMEQGRMPEQMLIKYPKEQGGSSNSVRVEQEMFKLSENTLMYNTTAQIISKKLRGIKEAIIESGRGR